jgi:hypothetical protein
VITGIVGICSDPKHAIFYTSNGEARQEFSIVRRGAGIGWNHGPFEIGLLIFHRLLGDRIGRRIAL